MECKITGRRTTSVSEGTMRLLKTGVQAVLTGTKRSRAARALSTTAKVVEEKRNEHKSKTLITTPIFYVNGKPHIGHAYSGLLCDGLARWLRLKGHDVIFSTGTDEHGSKVEKAAQEAGYESPKEFCDSISAEFRQLCSTLGLSNDVFIRTTDAEHKKTVDQIWKRLKNAGFISEGKHSGWYCQSDEAFLTDKQVQKHPEKEGVLVSSESGHEVEWLDETNYVFHLERFEDDLLAWLNSETDGFGSLSPVARKNEIETFLRLKSMKELSISRPSSRVRWALPVPDDSSQSVYVWLDALTNYLTVAGVKISSDPSINASWEAAGVEKVYHVVGKDIVRFHAIYWPAFLIAAGIRPPDHVIAHAHWTVDKTKMSKSLGNVICPFDLVSRYGRDTVRYALLRNGGLTDDADFSVSMLKARRKDDLANTLGNLLSRSVAKRISPYKSWPPERANLDPSSHPLGREFLQGLSHRVDQCFSRLEFAKGLDLIIATLHEANRIYTAEEPWVARKKLRGLVGNPGVDHSDPQIVELETTVDTTLFWMFETLRQCSILLQPVIPESAETCLDVLGIPKEKRHFQHACEFSARHCEFEFPPAAKGPVVLFPPLDEGEDEE